MEILDFTCWKINKLVFWKLWHIFQNFLNCQWLRNLPVTILLFSPEPSASTSMEVVLESLLPLSTASDDTEVWREVVRWKKFVIFCFLLIFQTFVSPTWKIICLFWILRSRSTAQLQLYCTELTALLYSADCSMLCSTTNLVRNIDFTITKPWNNRTNKTKEKTRNSHQLFSKIKWFRGTFWKIKWFRGTTRTTTNDGPASAEYLIF